MSFATSKRPGVVRERPRPRWKLGQALMLGHKSLMQYRLNKAIGRPFDTTVTVAKMIGSGGFDVLEGPRR
jgi:hypothetical protein